MKQHEKPPTSAEYIDRLIAKSMATDRALRYDRDLAAALGISGAALSLYRQGGNMSAIVAVKIALMLDLHPMETIAATMSHQAKTDADKAFWIGCFARYSDR